MSWSYILHRYERDSSLFHNLPTKKTYANNLLCVSWQKWRHTPSCACGPFLCFEVGFYLFSNSWIIRGNEKRVATTSKKDKEKRGVALFSNNIYSFFYFPLQFISFHCFCCSGLGSIHWSIKNSWSLEVCVFRT